MRYYDRFNNNVNMTIASRIHTSNHSHIQDWVEDWSAVPEAYQDLLRSLGREYTVYTTPHKDRRQVPRNLPGLSAVTAAPPCLARLTNGGELNLCRLADHMLGTRSLSCITCLYRWKYSSIYDRDD